MIDALVQFARTRNPDGPSMERWSTFAKGSENRIDFGDQIKSLEVTSPPVPLVEDVMHAMNAPMSNYSTFAASFLRHATSQGVAAERF